MYAITALRTLHTRTQFIRIKVVWVTWYKIHSHLEPCITVYFWKRKEAGMKMKCARSFSTPALCQKRTSRSLQLFPFFLRCRFPCNMFVHKCEQRTLFSSYKNEPWLSNTHNTYIKEKHASQLSFHNIVELFSQKVR